MGLVGAYGVARSLLTYYGPIWRRGRMSRFFDHRRGLGQGGEGGR